MIRISRSRFRYGIIAHPVLTILAVTVTANHYWLDGAVAAVLVVWAVAARRPPARSAPACEPARRRPGLTAPVRRYCRPRRRGLELGAELRVRDRGERLGPLPGRAAPQLGDAVLGDHDVDLVTRAGDRRALRGARDDARHGRVARARGGREAHQRPVLELEPGDRDEVLVAADARVLAAVDAIGDDLAVEVDRDRAVDRHDLVVGRRRGAARSRCRPARSGRPRCRRASRRARCVPRANVQTENPSKSALVRVA